jgi:hypothetical protein
MSMGPATKIRTMKLIGAVQLIGAVMLLVFASSAALAGPLPTDPAAIPAAQGSAVFSGTNPGLTHTIHATVEYAVYAPGTFSGSAALGLPADISGGSQYIYAYEIFNDGNDANVTLLSVGLFAGAVANNATLITHLPGTPEAGTAPNNSLFNPAAIGPKSNARWTFNSPNLAIGDHSDILIFASPYQPQWKVSSITGGFTTGASAILPSPIPEPGTFVLSAMAVACLVAARGLRRRGALRET